MDEQSEQSEWVAEIAEGNPELDQLIRGNQLLFESLAQRGVVVDMPRLMMQHLLSVLFPDAETRQQYELSFQQYLAEQLVGIEEFVTQQMQAARIETPTQGLFVPGQ